MSDFKDGGYVYDRPLENDTSPLVISDDQAQFEIRSFAQQMEPLAWGWSTDKWKPYFYKLPEGPGKIALGGLRNVVEFYTRGEITPVTGFYTIRDQKRAFVGDLAPKCNLESWHRKSERAVTRLSLVLPTTKKRHDLVMGTIENVTHIGGSSDPDSEPFPVDWFEYLPQIDGTRDYLVRRSGARTIALAGAVRHTLIENGFNHLWDRYITSVR